VGPYNRLVYFSPRGKPLTHAFVSTLLDAQHIVLVCGRYEGVDQRFLDHYAAEEVCVGDAVLSGGEIPAMMLLDACVRRLPGVLDKGCAVVEESFSPEASYGPGILEYPLYTRPRVWRGLAVPETLCSGDHAAVSQWRAEAAWAVTAQRRPELLAGVAPTGVHAERR
jgi:tRNA (guanine37-N1)-methyltransferase